MYQQKISKTQALLTLIVVSFISAAIGANIDNGIAGWFICLSGMTGILSVFVTVFYLIDIWR